MPKQVIKITLYNDEIERVEKFRVKWNEQYKGDPKEDLFSLPDMETAVKLLFKLGLIDHAE